MPNYQFSCHLCLQVPSCRPYSVAFQTYPLSSAHRAMKLDGYAHRSHLLLASPGSELQKSLDGFLGTYAIKKTKDESVSQKPFVTCLCCCVALNLCGVTRLRISRLWIDPKGPRPWQQLAQTLVQRPVTFTHFGATRVTLLYCGQRTVLDWVPYSSSVSFCLIEFLFQCNMLD